MSENAARSIDEVGTKFLIDGKEVEAEGGWAINLVLEDWQELSGLVAEYKRSLPWHVRLRLWFYRMVRR